MMPNLKKYICLPVIAFILSSCSYAIYDMNSGELKVPKKDTYVVNYSTAIPDGAEAKITYTDKDESHSLEHVTGKWVKEVILPSGRECALNVDVKVPKQASTKTMITSITVNGQSIAQQTQGGKKVKFHFGFKLP
jgi:hypothetical protein